jgi:hypothetical protein
MLEELRLGLEMAYLHVHIHCLGGLSRYVEMLTNLQVMSVKG